MADYFMLPEAAELIEYLRSQHQSILEKGCAIETIGKNVIADAIEADRMEIAGLRMRRDELYKKIDKLEAENAKLKAERDAAVADIQHICGKCYYSYYSILCPIEQAERATGIKQNRKSYTCDEWKWRGAKEEEDATERR